MRHFLKNYQRAGKEVEIADSLLNKGDALKTDEERILALYRTLQDAKIDKDTDYLKSITPDHVMHIAGRVQSIDEWLDHCQTAGMVIENNQAARTKSCFAATMPFRKSLSRLGRVLFLTGRNCYNSYWYKIAD